MTDRPAEGTTHKEYAGDGYYVTIVYCEKCHTYLGVNYPVDLCGTCFNKKYPATKMEGQSNATPH